MNVTKPFIVLCWEKVERNPWSRSEDCLLQTQDSAGEGSVEGYRQGMIIGLDLGPTGSVWIRNNRGRVVQEAREQVGRWGVVVSINCRHQGLEGHRVRLEPEASARFWPLFIGSDSLCWSGCFCAFGCIRTSPTARRRSAATGGNTSITSSEPGRKASQSLSELPFLHHKYKHLLRKNKQRDLWSIFFQHQLCQLPAHPVWRQYLLYPQHQRWPWLMKGLGSLTHGMFRTKHCLTSHARLCEVCDQWSVWRMSQVGVKTSKSILKPLRHWTFLHIDGYVTIARLSWLQDFINWLLWIWLTCFAFALGFAKSRFIGLSIILAMGFIYAAGASRYKVNAIRHRCLESSHIKCSSDSILIWPSLYLRMAARWVTGFWDGGLWGSQSVLDVYSMGQDLECEQRRPFQGALSLM